MIDQIELLGGIKMKHSKPAQSAVEMALITPLICLLLFGTVDLARYIRATVELNHAAQVGVSVAQNGYSHTGTPIANATVVAEIQQADPQATVIAPLSTGFVSPNAQYTVTLNSKFSVISPFVANLRGISSIRVTSTGTILP